MSHHYSGPTSRFPVGRRLDYTEFVCFFPGRMMPASPILIMDVHPSYDVIKSGLLAEPSRQMGSTRSRSTRTATRYSPKPRCTAGFPARISGRISAPAPLEDQRICEAIVSRSRRPSRVDLDLVEPIWREGFCR